MEVKTDTKEKFHVIRVITPILSANMAADLKRQFLDLLKDTIKNVVLNLASVKSIEEEADEIIVRIQQKLYESNVSYVICELDLQVEDAIDKIELQVLINVTRSE